MHRKAKNIKLVVADVDGTLTDGGMYITENGDHFKRFHTRDGMAAKLLMKSGIQVGLLSHSGVANMVTARANMLKLPYCYVGQEDKISILDGWRKELGLTWEEVAFIGDDINDIGVLEQVGFSACPSDAVPAVKGVVDVILTRTGGQACFREWTDEWLLS